ncbi:MAG: hypothetical protein ABJG88_10005 [Litorimonas sp.]
MTNTYRLSGQNGGVFSQLLRAAFFTITAIGGLLLLFFSAAFVLILIAGLAVLGFVVALVFWVRAKILGKPFGPKAKFEHMRREMEANMGSQFDEIRPDSHADHTQEADGPILDAHNTPEGWSVDN